MKNEETLEEAAQRLYPISKGGSMWMPSADDCNKANKQEGFIEGAKWQSERMYSEEEVYELLLKHQSAYRSAVRITSPLDWSFDIKQWFEQFKKKVV
jgi:hypothetical protein